MTTKENMTEQIKTLRSVRGPLMLWMFLIGLSAAYVMVTITALPGRLESSMREAAPTTISLRPFLVIFAITAVQLCIWFAPQLAQRWRPLPILLPLLLIVLYNSVINGAIPIILVGTYPVMMVETIIMYEHPQRLIRMITGLYVGIWIAFTFMVGWLHGFALLAAFILLMSIVMYYWHFYNRQVQERRRTEELYAELQLAYSQVEESAVRTERQRVARELHDTLTQGLAGVVMQLEAAEGFMDAGNNDRAHAVVHDSIATARTTLHDSRITLTDLRATTEESLPARLDLVAEAVRKNYQLTTTINLKGVPDYAPTQLTEITRIVSEALINVAKHADSTQAVVRGQQLGDLFKLQIIDFGRGFDVEIAKKLQKPGHFGLRGIDERATRLGGVITIISTPDEGTTLTLTMPTIRKDQL